MLPMRSLENRSLNPRPGFTLIEMLLVIVLIGIIAGAVVTSLSGRAREARITRATADIAGSLSMALDMFEQDIGRYPTNEEGLQVLIQNSGIQNWKGPYLKGAELKPDPWESPYLYSQDPQNEGQYILSSAGPDRQAGTEDDIKE